MKNCTFCGDELNELMVETNFSLKTHRLKEDDVWENIPNLNLTTREVLCENCFQGFIKVLNDEMVKRKK